MISNAQNRPFLAGEPELPEPPKFLGTHGRRFWQTIVEGFDIRPHQHELLAFAAHQCDRTAQIRRRLRAPKLTERARERLLGSERASQRAFLLARRELALDAPAKEQRGPRLGGRY